MQIIYRGYPQGLRMMESAQAAQTAQTQASTAQMEVAQTAQTRLYGNLQPYMIYQKNEQEEPVTRSQALRMEQEYFKGLYPLSVRRHQVWVDEACDHLDYAGSPMYDQYPDRIMIQKTCDRIDRNLQSAGMEANRDLTQLLLVNEMARRRLRRKI